MSKKYSGIDNITKPAFDAAKEMIKDSKNEIKQDVKTELLAGNNTWSGFNSFKNIAVNEAQIGYAEIGDVVYINDAGIRVDASQTITEDLNVEMRTTVNQLYVGSAVYDGDDELMISVDDVGEFSLGKGFTNVQYSYELQIPQRINIFNDVSVVLTEEENIRFLKNIDYMNKIVLQRNNLTFTIYLTSKITDNQNSTIWLTFGEHYSNAGYNSIRVDMQYSIDIRTLRWEYLEI